MFIYDGQKCLSYCCSSQHYYRDIWAHHWNRLFFRSRRGRYWKFWIYLQLIRKPLPKICSWIQWVLLGLRYTRRIGITELFLIFYIELLSTKNWEIIAMESKWLFEDLNAHHISVICILNYSANHESWG